MIHSTTQSWHKEDINEAVSRKQERTMFRSTIPHAAYGIRKIFETTQVQLKICLGSFHEDLTDTADFLRGLELYLRKNIPMQILLQKDLVRGSNTRAFQLLLFYSLLENKIKIKYSPYKITQDGFGMNFIIGDNQMHWIHREKDTHGDFNSKFNFGSIDKCAQWVHMFNETFSHKDSEDFQLW